MAKKNEFTRFAIAGPMLIDTKQAFIYANPSGRKNKINVFDFLARTAFCNVFEMPTKKDKENFLFGKREGIGDSEDLSWGGAIKKAGGGAVFAASLPLFVASALKIYTFALIDNIFVSKPIDKCNRFERLFQQEGSVSNWFDKNIFPHRLPRDPVRNTMSDTTNIVAIGLKGVITFLANVIELPLRGVRRVITDPIIDAVAIAPEKGRVIKEKTKEKVAEAGEKLSAAKENAIIQGEVFKAQAQEKLNDAVENLSEARNKVTHVASVISEVTSEKAQEVRNDLTDVQEKLKIVYDDLQEGVGKYVKNQFKPIPNDDKDDSMRDRSESEIELQDLRNARIKQ